MSWPGGRGPGTRIIAHRGARGIAPENTLLAARRALQQQADGWELDVRLSRDRVPVVIHDRSLVRTTDAADRFPDREPWQVDQFTAAELASLDAGSWFLRSDPFRTVGGLDEAEQRACRGERLPTLSQALALSHALNLPVNVEIKDLAETGVPDGEVVDLVAGVIEASGAAPLVLVSSFRLDYLPLMRRRLPGLPLGALFEDELPDWPLDLLKALGADAIHPEHVLISPGALGPFREAGIPVNCWTVNSTEVARGLIAAGVHALITDFPDRLRPLLAEASG